ncbi:hypothetical protein TCAL_05927 [Tigriopus californicus]|uniref:Uncharacterized protein n=1 Tax=Tigriopus californicus TaxID=6832 RepID=A0A553NZF5_TIGCA|nr:hypothetical protein TCAL_05927 [Tigriopus californicus]|eukprot:TCALIF_05927-PA protein Name:"Similar to ATP5S ATP synthase subunit s, mitochondrial (Bos taurus)" AED:0.00 eAED:0.00 QI:127/1/1/1/0.5/0.66/3/151/218
MSSLMTRSVRASWGVLSRSWHQVIGSTNFRPANNPRSFYGWFNSVFNKYDSDRVAAVGPDRACAEWLLRCGGGVVWKGSQAVFTDYNALPRTPSRSTKIEEIDGTDSCIMNVGFDYLKGLTELKKIKLKNATSVDDYALALLASICHDRLESLEVSDNGTVTDEGVSSLRKLKKLRHLSLDNLGNVDNPERVLQRLREELPSCHIEWPPFTGQSDQTD